MAYMLDHTYRIKRNAEQEERMRYLVELGVFRGYAQIICASAILGYNKKIYVPIKTTASDAVQIINFNEHEQNLMDYIAFSHTQQQAILKDMAKYTIFESYANGGFDLLFDALGIDMTNKQKNNKSEILNKIYKIFLLGTL